MYTVTNYKTKKQLIADFRAGKVIEVFQPGPFGPKAPDGPCCLEGPHYPEPHKWYASAVIEEGVVVKLTR